LKLAKIGGVTDTQLVRGIVIIILLFAIGLVLGLVVVPAITNK
jgi:hypothetical protein